MTHILTLVSGRSARKLADNAPGGVGAAIEHGGVGWSVTEREIDVKRQRDLIAYLEAEGGAAKADWAIAPSENRR